MNRLAQIALANDPALDIDTILDVLEHNIICHSALEWDFTNWCPM